MDKTVRTSLVPKKELHTVRDENSYTKRRSFRGPGYHIALFIFILTLLFSFGLFLYSYSLQGNIITQEVKLRGLYESFDVATIEDFIIKDARLRHVSNLLEEHVALSGLFSKIEDVTLRNVAYQKFQYKKKVEDNIPEISFTGLTNNFESVNLQLGQYKDDPSFNLANVISMEYTEDRFIQFGIATILDPNLILYARALGSSTGEKKEIESSTDVQGDVLINPDQ